MDCLKVRSLIEQYRSLSGLSSLPFFVKTAGHVRLCWFNYDVDQTEEMLKVFVQAIYLVDDALRPVEKPLVVHWDLPLDEYAEPAIDEAQYYAKLKELEVHYSEENMDKLISDAEPEPLPQIYRLVTQRILQMEGV